jgi:hypothetical protein
MIYVIDGKSDRCGREDLWAGSVFEQLAVKLRIRSPDLLRAMHAGLV